MVLRFMTQNAPAFRIKATNEIEFGIHCDLVLYADFILEQLAPVPKEDCSIFQKEKERKKKKKVNDLISKSLLLKGGGEDGREGKVKEWTLQFQLPNPQLDLLALDHVGASEHAF